MSVAVFSLVYAVVVGCIRLGVNVCMCCAAISKRESGTRSRHSTTRSTVGGPGAAGGNDSPFIVPLSDCDFAADRVLEGMLPEASKPVRFSPLGSCDCIRLPLSF